MCFDHDSRPPVAPLAGAGIDGREVELRSGDGTPFAGFAALAAEPTDAAMLVLPDVRGLHGYYRELALRFAEAGIDALAIDYFGRTAGVGTREEGFAYQEHVPRTTWEALRADAQAGAQWLRDERGTPALFSVGFCFGGRLSFLLGTVREIAMSGVIGFYGWPVGPSRHNDTPAPADVARSCACPVLALFGGADAGIPPEQVAAFDRALDEAGVTNDVVTYEGAPHSFFDRKQAEYAGDSADAWRRVLEFVRSNSGPAAEVSGHPS
jgi:carboxymethylenebutenolidase